MSCDEQEQKSKLENKTSQEALYQSAYDLLQSNVRLIEMCDELEKLSHNFTINATRPVSKRWREWLCNKISK